MLLDQRKDLQPQGELSFEVLVCSGRLSWNISRNTGEGFAHIPSSTMYVAAQQHISQRLRERNVFNVESAGQKRRVPSTACTVGRNCSLRSDSRNHVAFACMQADIIVEFDPSLRYESGHGCLFRPRQLYRSWETTQHDSLAAE